MRIPLIGGSFPSRSPIAGTAQSINLYPEINPDGSLVPFTYYQRPGLTTLVQGPNAPVRGLWRSSDGQGWCVIGQNLYYISPGFAIVNIGALTAGLSTPVSMVDNGAYLVVVDSSNNGWSVKLSDHSGFGAIAGFPGAVDVDFLDGFILYASPSSTQWGSTLFNSLTFDPTYVAKKIGWPDSVQALLVNKRQILIFGSLKSEVWYNAGNPTFRFAELPGAYIEHGLAAIYSHAFNDISVFWLGQDMQGQGIVFRHRGYDVTRISNHALEYAMSKMSTISDAIGLCFQYSGHSFFMLNFPTANQTWVFDDSIGEPKLAWHQETYLDPVNGLGRHRANCVANIYGKLVFGDYINGTLSALDATAFADNSNPILYTQIFPHLAEVPASNGQSQPLDGRRIKFNSFTADFESGTTGTDATNPPKLTLSWSDDRGRTFGTPINQSAGAQGQYLTQPIWRNLGIARDRIFRMDYTISGPAALNGAWIDGEVLDS